MLSAGEALRNEETYGLGSVDHGSGGSGGAAAAATGGGARAAGAGRRPSSRKPEELAQIQAKTEQIEEAWSRS